MSCMYYGENIACVCNFRGIKKTNTYENYTNLYIFHKIVGILDEGNEIWPYRGRERDKTHTRLTLIHQNRHIKVTTTIA